MSNPLLLELQELQTHFYTERGRVTAVDGISLQINRGEIVGLVGESGCGKSVTAQSILRLLDESAVEYTGAISFQGKNLLSLSPRQMQKVRGNEISMIFQDPLSSLNPVWTIGRQIMEPIKIHQRVSAKEAHRQALELLKLTGIPAPEKRMDEYPHELSGGMRQRAMIAIALACQPKLLIADEPTTALDVTIQAQILDLLRRLNRDLDMGMIFITHDLGVVAELCTRVVVMYLGQVVEEAEVESLFSKPLHPYTRGLMSSIPRLDGDRSQKLHVIKGMVPSLHDIPAGCRFASRCAYADQLCQEKMPDLQEHSAKQKVRCWHYDKISEDKEEQYACSKH